ASPYPGGATPSGGGAWLMWGIVGVLLLGANGTGVYFASRAGAPSIADARDASPADRSRPDRARPDPDQPDRWARPPDPRAYPDDLTDGPDDPDGSDDPDVAGLPGEVVDVGQGVKIIAPPGMAVQRQGGNVVIGDLNKVAILAGPITERSNNPDVLARVYAK